MSQRGRVIAAHGRQYVVETANGEMLPCFPRGKKSEIACGDWVNFLRPSVDQGVIERIEPRTSLLYRSNEFRQKLIAANADQIVIVVACEPAFSDELLARALLAAESQEIASLIVLNKCDLGAKLPAAREQLKALSRIGYPVIEMSAKAVASALGTHLRDKTSVLVGQSGMGKSTLVNALVPGAGAAIREISTALDTGKHTTTSARLYHLDSRSHLIDSPGLQEFGLNHLDPTDIAEGFVEFRPLLGGCRFRNCQHASEPGCAVREAVERGEVDSSRYDLFRRIVGR